MNRRRRDLPERAQDQNTDTTFNRSRTVITRTIYDTIQLAQTPNRINSGGTWEMKLRFMTTQCTSLLLWTSGFYIFPGSFLGGSSSPAFLPCVHRSVIRGFRGTSTSRRSRLSTVKARKESKANLSKNGPAFSSAPLGCAPRPRPGDRLIRS